ncbi:hypothetical protein RRSWK_06824 [Rhodopirellula sp. SWK7]|nr:hypothetical protein RRSWK_06824 [Rhodopirellula sp. SWK7]
MKRGFEIVSKSKRAGFLRRSTGASGEQPKLGHAAVEASGA